MHDLVIATIFLAFILFPTIIATRAASGDAQ
jgi:hypothetical protein